MNKTTENFTNNLIDAISEASKNHTGGFLKKSVFYTLSYSHAFSVAYLCKNSIIEDAVMNGYNYKVLQDKTLIF